MHNGKGYCSQWWWRSLELDVSCLESLVRFVSVVSHQSSQLSRMLTFNFNFIPWIRCGEENWKLWNERNGKICLTEEWTALKRGSGPQKSLWAVRIRVYRQQFGYFVQFFMHVSILLDGNCSEIRCQLLNRLAKIYIGCTKEIFSWNKWSRANAHSSSTHIIKSFEMCFGTSVSVCIWKRAICLSAGCRELHFLEFAFAFWDFPIVVGSFFWNHVRPVDISAEYIFALVSEVRDGWSWSKIRQSQRK